MPSWRRAARNPHPITCFRVEELADAPPPLISGVGAVLFSALIAGSAQALEGDFFVGPAGTPCAKTVDLMAKSLERDFHELAIGIGWTSTVNGGIAGVTQLFASRAGTWTIIRTVETGVTCITMSGEGWDRINIELPDPTRRMM